MGQTIAEKVFSSKVGRPVRAGEYVTAPVDCAMMNEAFALSWIYLNAAGLSKIWDPSKVVVVLDHFVPANSERNASIHAMIRGTARALNLESYYGEGEGIAHQVMMEKGHARRTVRADAFPRKRGRRTSGPFSRDRRTWRRSCWRA